MAAVSRLPNKPSPGTTHNGRTLAGPGPPGIPSRNSCVSCAAAKMKCSKDRPCCVRCSRRGLQCEYFIPKRAGRKPNSARSGSSSSVSPSYEQSLDGRSKTENNAASHLQAPRDEHPAHPTDFHDMMSPIDPMQRDQPMLSGWDADSILDGNYSNSQTPAPGTCNPEFDLSYMGGYHGNDLAFCDDFIMPTSNTFGNDHFRPPADQFLDMGTYPMPEHTSTTLQSMLQSVPADHTSVFKSCNPCVCMEEVLDRLHRLSQLAITVRATFVSKQHAGDAGILKTIMDVMAKNKEATSTVDTMLECSAEHDEGIVYVSSLLLFKVLGLYAAITCKTSSSQDAPSIEAVQRYLAEKHGSCRLSDELGTVTAQVVLNELHRLRRVIERLGLCLKERATKVVCSEMCSTGEITELDIGMAWPMPSTVFEQLGDSLRVQFQRLSLGIMDRLTAVRNEMPSSG